LEPIPFNIAIHPFIAKNPRAPLDNAANQELKFSGDREKKMSGDKPYRPVSATEVRNLSQYQRDVLLDHIDGAVDVSISNPHLLAVRYSLMKIGMLMASTPGPAANRPRASVLTERGRMAVGMVLGQYADALVRVGLVHEETPMRVLQRLRSGGKPPVSAETALEPARLAMKSLQK
jgi:hypothetical protein